ncbi:hypothetical protein SDC9_179755 [bioreactor metagenome]|uniref:Uncharacterized protein n=1 Tax=bioreactor metagenome TaxID=1076179 RepID=A0A645GZR5_9ZZZZ
MCRHMMPKLSFSSFGSASTLLKLPFTIPDSRLSTWLSLSGTTHSVRMIPSVARTAIIQKRALSPRAWVMISPSTMAIAKVMPKLTPINAIAFVRFCSRVKSDSSAITAAAIAPEPCNARPRIMPQMESDSAAITLPRINTAKPPTISGLRPIRSESSPKGIWKIACARP